MTRPVWMLIGSLPMYRRCLRMDLSVAKDLDRWLVNVPSSASLGRSYVEA
jgi:perosamine synthetase